MDFDFLKECGREFLLKADIVKISDIFNQTLSEISPFVLSEAFCDVDLAVWNAFLFLASSVLPWQKSTELLQKTAETASLAASDVQMSSVVDKNAASILNQLRTINRELTTNSPMPLVVAFDEHIVHDLISKNITSVPQYELSMFYERLEFPYCPDFVEQGRFPALSIMTYAQDPEGRLTVSITFDSVMEQLTGYTTYQFMTYSVLKQMKHAGQVGSSEKLLCSPFLEYESFWVHSNVFV